MNQNLEKQTKLSIIIPFYNAKNTLRRAVDSVLTQGYPNIEILLIDDGSTDGSSDIGDEIANLESKVACYHLENAGPSVARNCGIKEATGNLVGFLDSDDYFLPDCFNNVLKDYHRNHPDIIAFGLSKGKNIENANLFVPEKKIGCSSEEAIEQMFRSKAVDFYVWNKFFKRELFNHIVFPENKLYEDMVPMYEAFRAASKIDILPFSGIFYYQNNDSIVYQSFNSKQYDNILQRKILVDEVKKDYPRLINLANARLVDGYLSTGFKITGKNQNQKEKQKYYNQSKREIKSIYSKIRSNNEISIAKKLALFLYLINPKTYFILYKKVLKK